jgi:hypothetical protein
MVPIGIVFMETKNNSNVGEEKKIRSYVLKSGFRGSNE